MDDPIDESREYFLHCVQRRTMFKVPNFNDSPESILAFVEKYVERIDRDRHGGIAITLKDGLGTYPVDMYVMPRAWDLKTAVMSARRELARIDDIGEARYLYQQLVNVKF